MAHQDLSLARQYLPLLGASTIATLPDADALRLGREGRFSVSYAPFDHVETGARLVIVGITPGMTQARNAAVAALRALNRGADLETALREAKATGAFSGPIRGNLLRMLDAIGLSRLVGVDSMAEAFRHGSGLVHLTSALRYPVFHDGKNYSGTPSMLRQSMLRGIVERHLAEEAGLLPNALWLPLGPQPAAALDHLVSRGSLDPRQILKGLPHPSPANNERIQVFLGEKDPAQASAKTNAARLLAALDALRDQVARI